MKQKLNLNKDLPHYFLHQDEVGLALYRHYPLKLRWPFYGFFFGLIMAILIQLYTKYTLEYLILIPTGLIFLRGLIGWYYSYVLVTNYQVLSIEQKGLFNREIRQIQLKNIQNVNFAQRGLVASLLGYGDIEVVATFSNEIFYFKSIMKPQDLQNILMRLISQL
ncbi:PH domain-containing protein [Candidatus Saccharibacteria bacterium]|nr:PH domain-containing protein [Candidatus Saccharibacteria bacterium]